MDNITNASSDGVIADDGLIQATVSPQWAYNVELALMVVVFVVGIPGNAIIIIVQVKTVNKTSTDYLVLIMAVYELLCSSMNTVTRMFVDINAVWLVVSSAFVCKITPVFYYLAQYGSAQMLGMLAVDRCIKTVFPLSSWYGKNQALGVSVIILLISVTLTSPRAVTYTVQESSKKCAFTLKHQLLGKYFGIAGSILSVVLFVVLSLSYAMIAIALKKRHLKKLQHRTGGSSYAQNNTNILQEDSSTIASTVGSMTSCNTQGTVADVESGMITYGKTTQKKKPAPATKSKMLTMEERNLNRLTVLMFLISLIYVASNSILWFLFMTSPFILGKAMLRLSFSIPMVNCISNPILFFSMSSRFRTNVKTLFRCR